nr:unnamed protein product [Digitaria exilis]
MAPRSAESSAGEDRCPPGVKSRRAIIVQHAPGRHYWLPHEHSGFSSPRWCPCCLYRSHVVPSGLLSSSLCASFSGLFLPLVPRP